MFRPVTSTEVQRAEGLIASLPPGQAQAVEAMWGQLVKVGHVGAWSCLL